MGAGCKAAIVGVGSTNFAELYQSPAIPRTAHSPAAYDALYGMTSPGAYVSMMYRRHQYEYGTPPHGLAALAINNRKNGALNAAAVFQKPISSDDYYASPFIAELLRLLDYCMINDGGVCLIVAAADMARHLKRPPSMCSPARRPEVLARITHRGSTSTRPARRSLVTSAHNRK